MRFRSTMRHSEQVNQGSCEPDGSFHTTTFISDREWAKVPRYYETLSEFIAETWDVATFEDSAAAFPAHNDTERSSDQGSECLSTGWSCQYCRVCRCLVSFFLFFKALIARCLGEVSWWLWTCRFNESPKRQVLWIATGYVNQEVRYLQRRLSRNWVEN
jgi:hypothetical protein